MNTEVKSCQSCKVQFTIDPADLLFYQKMGVTAPTLCPPCRFKRKALWRNERTLYQRNCDLCKRAMLSCISPSSPYTVYCQDCYYSDKWSPFDYGLDYDPKRPFFEQLRDLLSKAPKRNIYTSSAGTNTNSEYQNFAGQNKDCYMVFNTGYCEAVLYSRGLREVKDSLDCYYGTFNALSYECINTHDSSGMVFGQNVRNCTDSWFLRDCTACTNCFGCVNLRYKNYCFFNEQLTEEEYKAKLDKIRGSYEMFCRMREKFEELSSKRPHKENHNLKSEDVSGDYIVDSKNCRNCFEADKCEDCAYAYFVKTAKDSRDIIGFGFESELLLETVAVGHSHRVIGTYYADFSHDVEYCFDVNSAEWCIGCDGLRHAKFAVLNKKYSEDGYKKLRAHIVAELKKVGEYGAFFPPELAPFAYNETIGQDYMPLKKAEVAAFGFRWQEDMPGTRGKETLKAEAIPDRIEEVKDDILDKILACASCGRNYKLVGLELTFYRKMFLPIPRECFNCRHVDRLRRRGPMQLFDRACAKCERPVKTTFAPERPEIVFCEKCYTDQVV